MLDVIILRVFILFYFMVDVLKYFEIFIDEEKWLFELFYVVIYVDLFFKLEELKCVYDEFKCSRDAYLVFLWVVVGVLVLKFFWVRLFVEFVGGIGDDVIMDVFLYVGGRVCDDANVDGVF